MTTPRQYASLLARVDGCERDIRDLKQGRAKDSDKLDELIAQVAGLNGRMAGYLVAGMVLAAGVATLMQQAMKG